MRGTGTIGCGRRKTLNKFGVDNSKSDGRLQYCLPCSRKISKRNDAKRDARRWLKKRYNITPEQRDAMVEAQNGVCGRCRTPFKSARDRQVDHDHDCPNGCTGRTSCGSCVRGVLCFACNRLLSASWAEAYPDDPYLRAYRERRTAVTSKAA
jgi:hypothetical protein